MTTLSNQEIENEINGHRLVTEADSSQIGGACYELRLGSTYYDLTESDHPRDASPHGNVLIKPGHRVVLISHEKLDIPFDMIARVASKGSLFSIGLSPVSTYADPGFRGNLGIVTQNISDKYILLPIGEAIAKIEFAKLTSITTRPYNGQHGFQTRIWPIKHQFQKNYQDVEADSRVKSESEEALAILPYATAQTIKRLVKRQNWFNVAILANVLIASSLLAAAVTKNLDPIVSIIGNLISSVIAGIFVWMAQKEG
ncbi:MULTISPECIES: hypothetical protein [unclassified Massilia]|uniref:dCTP deaminase domain-containing protein n=1 Tax=unclassified Massilia TaxID=2609279 RepID=UPI001783903C|nr:MULTISPECIES: hypothetical protein [unclassified Massilia]MBD8529209.1 hypothetical protein [Massilia sp. CFBP 13647]MBD8672603.1 hypothetical protein [Massilia sp. CFBP 13721]